MGTPPPQLPAALAWGRAGVPSCAGGFQRNVSFLSLPAPLGGGRPRVNAGCAPGPGAGGPSLGERCLLGAAWPAPSALGRGPSRGGSVKSPPGVGIGGGGGAWRGAFGCWAAEGSPILLSRCVPSSGPQPVSLRFWLFLGKCPQVSRSPRPGFRSCLPLCVSLHVPGFWKSSRVCQVGLGLCLSVPLLLWGGESGVGSPFLLLFPRVRERESESQHVRAERALGERPVEALAVHADAGTGGGGAPAGTGNS